ncbi:MAG: hypothetical protein ACJ72Q_11380 [Nitrososphaeraceae archaeon]
MVYIDHPSHILMESIQTLYYDGTTVSRLYIIGLSGVGAGVAGIIIAAAALSRRNVLEVS